MKSLFRGFARCAAAALLTGLADFANAQESFEFQPQVEESLVAEPVSLRTEVSDLTELDTATEVAAPAAPKCDAKKLAALKKAVATSHKVVFYDNNFSYVLDPCYDEWYLGDSLKRMCGPHCSVLDIGGQYRARLHNERNHRGLGLTGRDDDFLLHRTRLFANWELGDNFRLFGEYLDAESNYEDFPPRNIEVNRSDFLNIFGDAKIHEFCEGDLWLRVGRQELLYGAQRTISPLDWANTRRTFDGAKLFYRSSDWDVDAFWTHPVVIDPIRFDAPNEEQEFMGVYATYKHVPNRTVDFYALRYIQTIAAPQPFEFNTFGLRYQGTECSWVWDCEAAYQGGNFGANDHTAGFYTLGGGRKWDDHCWKPQLIAYYDWASGSDQLNNGYHHLFPLSHRYLGFMDLYGRRNIEDANLQLTMKPREKLTVLAWYHAFFLQNGNDVPYNVNMTPFVLTPGGSQYLGQELDLLFTWNFHPRQDLQFGYSHFWHGSWYETNPAAPFAGDADFFYTQYTVNF